MAWVPTPPVYSPVNLADFVTFVTGQLPNFPKLLLTQLTAYVTDSQAQDVLDNIGVQVTSTPAVTQFETVLTIATEIVNDTLCIAGQDIYVLAVYNLATDALINYGVDLPGQTYFQDLRGKSGYNLNSSTPGVVSSTSDESTSATFLNPEWMKTATMMDLQNLKTPWGRRYIGLAQSVGTLWGVS